MAGGGVEGIGAFLVVPAVVAALDDLVDLLDVVLSDIGNDQLVGAAAIEAEAIRISHAIGVDFLDRIGDGGVDEGVVGGDAVFSIGAVVAVGVDAENFSEGGGGILSVAGRGVVTCAGIVGRPTVTGGDVEFAIGSELEGASIVIELGLVDAHQLAAGIGIDRVGVVGIDGPFSDDVLAIHRRSIGH